MTARATIASLGVAAGVAAIAAAALMRTPSTHPDDHGIVPCPTGALEHVLSSDALQCWLDGPHGRWRTLAHVSAHGALVVHVAATDLVDAETIAQRFVDDRGEDVSEVVVYVQQDEAPSMTRRVQWLREGGITTLEFAATEGPAKAGRHE